MISLRNYILCFILIFVLSSFNFYSDNIEIPSTNKMVIEYCNKKMNKKVDRGECWDLAKFALDYAEANWKPPLNFGKVVNYEHEIIYPGDIIQFENVKIQHQNGLKERYMIHTAIVYDIIEKGKYIIAHQNVNGVRKVRKDTLNLHLKIKGEVTFYRPIAKF